MKTTTINFNNANYQIKTGDVFQAKFDNGTKGQTFILRCKDDEKVVLEIIEKISNHLVLMRVNSIEWGEKEEVKKENYNESIHESNMDTKSINDMTKKELLSFADEHGLSINKKLNKGKLLEEIKNLL